MPKRDYDPLTVIPSAEHVRRVLARIREQARKLEIVLRTAEEIEAGEARAERGATGSAEQPEGQGVADAHR